MMIKIPAVSKFPIHTEAAGTAPMLNVHTFPMNTFAGYQLKITPAAIAPVVAIRIIIAEVFLIVQAIIARVIKATMPIPTSRPLKPAGMLTLFAAMVIPVG